MKRLLFALVFAIFLITNVSSSTWTSDLNNGLIAYYNFDEASGTNLTDNLRGIYNGTIGSEVSINNDTSIIGKSYRFKSNTMPSDCTSAVLINQGDSETNTGQMTINTWVYPTNYTTKNTILSAIYNLSYTYSYFIQILNLGTDITAGFYDGGLKEPAGSNIPPKGKWTMMTYTINSTTIARYQNGTFLSNITGSYTLDNIYIGCFGATPGEGSSGWIGNIDETAYWNRTLTSGEISNLWNEGAGISPEVLTENRVILLKPEDNSQITSENITDFSANITTIGGNISNATLKIWFNNNSLYHSNFTELNGISLIINNSKTIPVGIFYWNYEVYDNSSNLFTATSNFTISKQATITSVNYQNTSVQTASQKINITVLTGSGITLGVSVFEYNGTNYTTTKTSLGENTYLISTDLQTPSVVGNINFKWYLPITDVNTGVQFIQTSSTYNQTIEELTFGLCSVYSTRVLNFTFYDETTGLKIPGATNATSFEATFSYGVSPDNLGKNFSTSQLSTALSSFTFCTNTTQNFYMDMIAEYSAVDYTSKNYYLSNATITNSSNNISLFLIPDADAIQFFITVKQDLTPVEGAYVQVNKYFVGDGTYKTVEIDTTDSGGLFTSYLELDKNYRFVVIKDGEVLGTVDKVSSCKAAPCELELILSSSIGDLFEAYGEYFALNVLYNLSYNPATKFVTFDFVDTTGLATSFRMDILRTDPINGSVLIYTHELFTSSGTMTYNMTDEIPGNYIVNTYISRSPYKFIDYLNFLKSDVYNDLGRNGLILTIVFLVVIVFALAVKPILLLIAVPLALMFLNMIGLFNVSWQVLLGLFIMVILGGILLRD